jgi:serine/threonine-protein kinase
MQAAFTPGSVVAGHRIEAVIGQGGMGVVYRATHLALDKTVALKVIAPHLAHDAGFVERFKRESQVAARIDHPNVIPIYHAGEHEGLYFMTMRLVEGSDLRTFMTQRGMLDASRALFIIDAVAKGLDAAHLSGLVHRDVKPGNVLLGGTDDTLRVYLTDFGLTKRTISGGALTATGQFVGTFDYVSPEQIQSGEVDGRSDIYALGCVFYEMLTGSVPFPVVEDAAKLFAHISSTPTPVAESRPDLRALDDVINRAMAKQPEDRYPTAGEFASAAAAAFQGGSEPGQEEASTRFAPSPSPSPETRTTPRPSLTHGGDRPLDPSTTAPATKIAGGQVATSVGRATERGASEADATFVPAAPRTHVATEARRPARRARPTRSARYRSLLGLVVVAAAAVAALLLMNRGGSSDVTSIRLGGAAVDVDAQGGAVWVASGERNGTVAEVDSDSKLGAPIAVGADPLRVAGDATGAWVGTLGRRLVRIDRATGKVAKRTLDQDVHGMAVGEGAVWIANGGGSVVRASAETDSVDPIQVGRRPVDVAVGEAAVWVVNADDGEVVRIDPQSRERVGRPIEVKPRANAIAVGAGSVWVTNPDERTLTRLDPTSNRVRGKPLKVPAPPTDVAAGARAVWVVAGRNVYRYALADLETPRRVELPADGERIAVGPDAVWVTSASDDRLFRIDPQAAGS